MICFNPKTVTHETYEDEYEKRDIFCFKKVSSTNTIAKDLALRGYNAAVLADSQYRGHGRMSRRWESEAGGLYLTVSLKTELQDCVVPVVSMAASVAVLQSTYAFTGLKCSVKWPNDLLINGRKICGIISEAVWGPNKLDFVLVGIGLNVNQASNTFSPMLKGSVTSIYEETGKQYVIKDLAFSIIHNMNCALDNMSLYGTVRIIDQYRQYCSTIGKEISICDGEDVIFQGKAVAVNDDGALVVKNKSGRTEIFHYGEVSNRSI